MKMSGKLPQRSLGGPRRRRGVVAVEYLILLTIVGIGTIVGLVAVRDAVVLELNDVANAIAAISASGTPPAASATYSAITVMHGPGTAGGG